MLPASVRQAPSTASEHPVDRHVVAPTGHLPDSSPAAACCCSAESAAIAIHLRRPRLHRARQCRRIAPGRSKCRAASDTVRRAVGKQPQRASAPAAQSTTPTVRFAAADDRRDSRAAKSSRRKQQRQARARPPTTPSTGRKPAFQETEAGARALPSRTAPPKMTPAAATTPRLRNAPFQIVRHVLPRSPLDCAGLS